jgi:putative sterol carrier protein/putative NADPH-quinone reductase
MKVLALNSSPRGGGQSKTEWMLDHLVSGMQSAGATVEKIDLRKKKINFCIGCFTCWSKTPGKCVHKDDMSAELFPKFIEAALVVYATPLYHFTINAQMKAFIERTLPMLQPFLIKKENGKTSHPLRYPHPEVVWVSVAGFPELSVFDQLSHYIQFMYKDKLLAEIYRPAAETMMGHGREAVREAIAKGVQQAGKELVEVKSINPETMETIHQPIFTSQNGGFHGMGNLFWKTCIEEGVTPKEFEMKGMIPRPDSLESFMAILKMGFNPEGASGVKAIIQYCFSGNVEGDCYFNIENGSIEAKEGRHANPTVTIHTPFEVWMDIMTGKVEGQEMFFQEKYAVEGDLDFMMKMEAMFGRKKED